MDNPLALVYHLAYYIGMNTETINAIKEALIPVAEKMGQGAEYAWGVVVRQQYVEGVAMLVAAVLLVFAAFAGMWLIRKALAMPKVVKRWSETKEMGDLATFCMMIGSCLQMVWIPVMLLTVYGVMQLLNPEYYALEFFMDLVKSQVK